MCIDKQQYYNKSGNALTDNVWVKDDDGSYKKNNKVSSISISYGENVALHI